MVGGAPMMAEAAPFDSAKITRAENNVSVGEVSGGKATGHRPAKVSQTLRANNFVQTGSDSRAQLEFPDTSLVRVGQNSVFTFESKSRTLSLQKGDMLFYVAPGQGAGTIKTPALTAAITGTLCKVSTNTIAVLRGSITIFIEGKKVKIPAGWAVTVIKGKVHVYKFDPKEAGRGKLYAMGPLPEDPAFYINPGNLDSLQNAIDLALVNFHARPIPEIPKEMQMPVNNQPVTPTETTRNPTTNNNPPKDTPGNPVTGNSGGLQ